MRSATKRPYWRRLLGRAKGADGDSLILGCDSTGARVRVIGRPVIENRGRFAIGSDVVIDASCAPVIITTVEGAELQVGSRVSLGFGTRVDVNGRVSIGDGVRIGPFVTITDLFAASGGVGRHVVIGDGVTIGAGARIEAGAHVGAGATIRAGAVVRDVVPAGGVVDAPEVPREVSQPEASREDSLRVRPEQVADRRARGVIIADFTADDLASALQRPDAHPLTVEVETAGFGQVVQTLARMSQDGERRADFAVVWTLAEQAVPEFAGLARGEEAGEAAILSRVDEFAATLAACATAARVIFVASWALTPERRGLGMLDLRKGGLAATLLKMNLRLAEALADTPNVFVLDAQRWVAYSGLAAVRPKLWFLGKVPFGSDTFLEAARDIRAALCGFLGMSKKLVVLDLDDTLWGGIVGDVGWQGLSLGGHDAAGEAYVRLQHDLLALHRRGIALAVVSKNEESVALEAMRLHPEMVIRPEHLSAYRINWGDKAQNIVEIAAELNLGLQSVVFIDDNPVERGRVREALSEVHVPDWPADPALYPAALEALRCFDTPTISAEDAARSAMYAVERERTAGRTRFQSLDEWLESLGVRVRFEPLARESLPRAAQLLNKTNQMNLRTRRLTETELSAWAAEPECEFWTVHVGDRFGESGLTGLLGLRRDADEVHVEDFVLSCRVMGRRVEDAIVWAAVERARTMGGETLVVEPIATAKNKPCRDFWRATALRPTKGDPITYQWPVREVFPAPPTLVVAGLTR